MKYRWEQNYVKHSIALKNNPLHIKRGAFPIFLAPPRISLRKVLQIAVFCYSSKNKNPRKRLIYRDYLVFALLICGERGIRTPGTPKGTTDFESAPIDHSGSSPKFLQMYEKVRIRNCIRVLF